MTVWACCNCVFNSVVSTVSKLNLVVNLQIWRIIGSALEWRWLGTHLTYSVGSQKHLGNNVLVPSVHDAGCLHTLRHLGRTGQPSFPRCR